MRARLSSIDATGLPLGLFDEAEYDELSFKAKPGDLFVFYQRRHSRRAQPPRPLFWPGARGGDRRRMRNKVGGLCSQRDFQSGDRTRRGRGYIRRSDGGRDQSERRPVYRQTQVKRARESSACGRLRLRYRAGDMRARTTDLDCEDLDCEELYCEAVALERLAARHGTPLYVYSAAMIRARLRAFAGAFRAIPHTLCYSVKANSTLAILRLVAGEGAGFDVVSGGELQRVLRVQPQSREQSCVLRSG